MLDHHSILNGRVRGNINVEYVSVGGALRLRGGFSGPKKHLRTLDKKPRIVGIFKLVPPYFSRVAIPDEDKNSVSLLVGASEVPVDDQHLWKRDLSECVVDVILPDVKAH